MQVNTVVLNGNLVADAEVKEFPNSSVTKFRLAFHQGRGKNETTGYIDAEKWGEGAAALTKYLTKGRGVVVEGRLKMDSWEKDGKTHSKPVLVVNNLSFVPKGEKKAEESSSPTHNNLIDDEDLGDDDAPPF